MDRQYEKLSSDFANLQATVTTMAEKQRVLTEEIVDLKKELAIVKLQVKNLVEHQKEATANEIEARDDIEAQQRRYNLNISGITQLDKDEN